MITASAQLASHLKGEVTSLAMCWKLTLSNNTVMGFTDHTSDLFINDILYQAASGFSPSSIETSDKFSVDNLEVTGILDANSIDENDIMAGIYDFAEIEVFMVNANDLSQGIIIRRRGWLGEISIKNGQFITEVRGLAQKLNANIIELYSPTCRAVFGDKRCKVNLANYTFAGQVDVAHNKQMFTSNDLTQTAGYFANGELLWLSGANINRKIEIKEFSNNQIILVLPMPDNIEVGDKFEVIAGCDKTLQTCCNKFNNVINFRGEPYVPGMDRILSHA